jgi:hypothetical protein
MNGLGNYNGAGVLKIADQRERSMMAERNFEKLPPL